MIVKPPPEIELTSMDGAFLIPFGLQKLKLAERRRLRSRSAEKTEEYQVGDYLVTVISAIWRDTIRIDGGETLTGFAIHPRVDTSADVGLDFPLIDDDGGTNILEVDGDSVSLDSDPDDENYGNLHSSAEGDTLTWKGPPGVAIEIDPYQPVAGLTVEDDISNLLQRYTAFRSTVYNKGETSHTLPEWGIIAPKVLCAGYDATGRLLILAGTNYQNTQNPEGGIGGYFDELVTTGDGESWTRLHVRRSSRHTLPAFLALDGTRIVTQFGQYTIADNLEIAFQEHPSVVAGFREYAGSGWSVEFDAKRQVAHHLGGSLQLSFSGTDKSTIHDHADATIDSVPVYAPVDDALWVTLSEDNAGCGCPTAGGYGYKYYDDGYRDIVYWTVSAIPVNFDYWTFAEIREAMGQTTYVQSGVPCGDGTYTWPIYEGVISDLLEGEWVEFPEGFISTVSQFTWCYTCSVPWDPAITPGWYKTNNNPAYVYRYGGPWPYYNGTCNQPITSGFGFSATGARICSDYLSDSYKADLTDIYGSQLSVPDSVNGYQVKVCKVVHQRCA